MKKLLLSFFFVFSIFSSHAQVKLWDNDAFPLHRAEKALTDVIIHDIFSPPVASRIYLYTNMAAYEVLVKQNDDYNSLSQQVKGYPSIPGPSQKISYSLAAVYAFLLTGQKLVFSEPVLQDSLNNILKWYKEKGIDPQVYKASLNYAEQVCDTIMNWVLKDQYKETRKLRRYNFLKEEGKWIPTPPGYMAAVESNWSMIRPVVLDSSDQFRPAPPTKFSKDKNSSFYREAYEVYEAVNKLSDEQRAIASFWDCNPFFLNTQGHLNFATKKISPGGHWISIAGLAAQQTGADIIKSSAAYTLTSIALFDGFIICWDEKFRSNLIRPETYINANIDEKWRPLLQTPPFPEYTSGHSVVSTAAAIVLTDIFGEQFAFNDNTEVEFGLPVRKFTSFIDACNEAAISRLYGGIHYRPAIENGQVQGKLIAELILERIKLKSKK